jgi:glycosyltransferase involved in cell wall biosynthesis
MVDVSVIIPARNEVFLTPTIEDLVKNARADTEIIAVLEGYWPERMVEADNVHYVHFTDPRGMRGAINAGAALARGKYLMKLDGHCAVDEGYDAKLMEGLEEDWIAVPRRESLNPEEWRPRRKKHIDYMFLCYPDDPNDFGGPSLKGKIWRDLNNSRERMELDIDDLMSAQGSCWFMHRDYFYWLDLMDEVNYGHFSNEFQEIGLKCWLSGGRVIRNKRTWYAHLHKGRKHGRGWPLGKSVLRKGAAFTNRWMDGRNWRKQDRDIRWMVDKFWPVPTWPEESVRLVFNRRRGGSGDVRGEQMARHFKARLNLNEPVEDWHYPFDVHIWVKQEPRHLEWPGKHYLDIMDATERGPWAREHPECGLIAMSLSGQEWLAKRLGREDVVWIRVHHCNFDRLVRERDGFSVAGVCGGPGAIQCDEEQLEGVLAEHGLEWRWYQDYRGPADITEFYRNIDVQVVWRTMRRPLKDPEKIVNAMSLGVPTVAYPEPAYKEVEGYYWPVRTFDELGAAIEELRGGYDAQRLIDKAEEYHIDSVAQLYGQLL